MEILTGKADISSLSHWTFLSLASYLSGDYEHCRFVPEMAKIIETEFGIRALQAALVERRNKDRLGHIFCHLRLIIIPGVVHKGKGTCELAPHGQRPPWICWEGRPSREGAGGKHAGEESSPHWWGRRRGLSVGQACVDLLGALTSCPLHIPVHPYAPPL